MANKPITSDGKAIVDHLKRLNKKMCCLTTGGDSGSCDCDCAPLMVGVDFSDVIEALEAICDKIEALEFTLPEGTVFPTKDIMCTPDCQSVVCYTTFNPDGTIANTVHVLPSGASFAGDLDSLDPDCSQCNDSDCTGGNYTSYDICTNEGKFIKHVSICEGVDTYCTDPLGDIIDCPVCCDASTALGEFIIFHDKSTWLGGTGTDPSGSTLPHNDLSNYPATFQGYNSQGNLTITNLLTPIVVNTPGELADYLVSIGFSDGIGGITDVSVWGNWVGLVDANGDRISNFGNFGIYPPVFSEAGICPEGTLECCECADTTVLDNVCYTTSCEAFISINRFTPAPDSLDDATGIAVMYDQLSTGNQVILIEEGFGPPYPQPYNWRDYYEGGRLAMLLDELGLPYELDWEYSADGVDVTLKMCVEDSENIGIQHAGGDNTAESGPQETIYIHEENGTLIKTNDCRPNVLLDCLGNEVTEPYDLEKCKDKTDPTAQCWKDQFIEGGLDNSFTSFRHLNQTFLVTFNDGTTDTFSFPSSSSWGNQVDQISAGLSSVMPWALTTGSFCNRPGGCGGLPEPLLPLEQMFARYSGFRLCPTDKIPVRVQYTSNRVKTPRDLVIQYKTSDVKYFNRCVDCGCEDCDLPNVDQWTPLSEDSYCTPYCPIPCVEDFKTLPKPSCTTELICVCDDLATDTVVYGQYQDCGDGAIAIGYWTIDPADPDQQALIEYTPLGAIQGCGCVPCEYTSTTTLCSSEDCVKYDIVRYSNCPTQIFFAGTDMEASPEEDLVDCINKEVIDQKCYETQLFYYEWDNGYHRYRPNITELPGTYNTPHGAVLEINGSEPTAFVGFIDRFLRCGTATIDQIHINGVDLLTAPIVETTTRGTWGSLNRLLWQTITANSAYTMPVGIGCDRPPVTPSTNCYGRSITCDDIPADANGDIGYFDVTDCTAAGRTWRFSIRKTAQEPERIKSIEYFDCKGDLVCEYYNEAKELIVVDPDCLKEVPCNVSESCPVVSVREVCFLETAEGEIVKLGSGTSDCDPGSEPIGAQICGSFNVYMDGTPLDVVSVETTSPEVTVTFDSVTGNNALFNYCWINDGNSTPNGNISVEMTTDKGNIVWDTAGNSDFYLCSGGGGSYNGTTLGSTTEIYLKEICRLECPTIYQDSEGNTIDISELTPCIDCKIEIITVEQKYDLIPAVLSLCSGQSGLGRIAIIGQGDTAEFTIVSNGTTYTQTFINSSSTQMNTDVAAWLSSVTNGTWTMTFGADAAGNIGSWSYTYTDAEDLGALTVTNITDNTATTTSQLSSSCTGIYTEEKCTPIQEIKERDCEGNETYRFVIEDGSGLLIPYILQGKLSNVCVTSCSPWHGGGLGDSLPTEQITDLTLLLPECGCNGKVITSIGEIPFYEGMAEVCIPDTSCPYTITEIEIEEDSTCVLADLKWYASRKI